MILFEAVYMWIIAQGGKENNVQRNWNWILPVRHLGLTPATFFLLQSCIRLWSICSQDWWDAQWVTPHNLVDAHVASCHLYNYDSKTPDYNQVDSGIFHQHHQFQLLDLLLASECIATAVLLFFLWISVVTSNGLWEAFCRWSIAWLFLFF